GLGAAPYRRSFPTRRSSDRVATSSNRRTGRQLDLFLQTLLNGLLIGGVVATFSIAFQLTFGVLHVIDFAVGAWVVLGGYFAYYIDRKSTRLNSSHGKISYAV